MTTLATINHLKAAGFTDNEANIYTALLELGPSVANVVAKKTKINRSTTYVTLEALVKRGIVSVSDQKKVRIYGAQPEYLVRSTEESAKCYSKLADELKKSISKIRRIRAGGSPTIQTLEGDNGVEAAYQVIFTQRKRVTGILPDTPDSRDKFKMLAHKADKAIYLGKKHRPFSAEIYIYGDNVALVSSEVKSAVMIENKGMTDHFRTLFDLASARLERTARRGKK